MKTQENIKTQVSTTWPQVSTTPNYTDSLVTLSNSSICKNFPQNSWKPKKFDKLCQKLGGNFIETQSNFEKNSEIS